MTGSIQKCSVSQSIGFGPRANIKQECDTIRFLFLKNKSENHMNHQLG